MAVQEPTPDYKLREPTLVDANVFSFFFRPVINTIEIISIKLSVGSVIWYQSDRDISFMNWKVMFVMLRYKVLQLPFLFFAKTKYHNNLHENCDVKNKVLLFINIVANPLYLPSFNISAYVNIIINILVINYYFLFIIISKVSYLLQL